MSIVFARNYAVFQHTNSFSLNSKQVNESQCVVRRGDCFVVVTTACGHVVSHLDRCKQLVTWTGAASFRFTLRVRVKTICTQLDFALRHSVTEGFSRLNVSCTAVTLLMRSQGGHCDRRFSFILKG